MTGAFFAAGPCAFCRRIFAFNPERVPSLPVDAEGRVVPDGIRHPICGPCMDKVNAFRAECGAEPVPILPGAYDPAEGFPP
jgi:hypothetical protein